MSCNHDVYENGYCTQCDLYFGDEITRLTGEVEKHGALKSAVSDLVESPDREAFRLVVLAFKNLGGE